MSDLYFRGANMMASDLRDCVMRGGKDLSYIDPWVNGLKSLSERAQNKDLLIECFKMQESGKSLTEILNIFSQYVIGFGTE